VIRKHALRHPDVASIYTLVVEDWGAGDDPIEVVRVTLRFHQGLAASRRATFEVGVGWRTAIVDAHNRFRGVCRQVDGTIPKVQDRIEIVIRKGRARFSAAIVTGVRIRNRVPLGESLIGKIELSILPSVSNVEKASIPIRWKGELHMKPNSP
jgi:hypothetical protein